jgi:GST-like protein
MDLYTFGTPNGFKVSIALEELGIRYAVHAVQIGKGEQFLPAFVALNSNSKIPVIVDRESGLVLPESVAILMYLADKKEKLFPRSGKARIETIQWLMFQASSIGPMMGQYNHFKLYAPVKVPYAIERYETEGYRLLSVLNKRLAEGAYLVGDSYTIADIATWPWIRSFQKTANDTLERFSNLKRWYAEIEKRPAVAKGLLVPAR